MSRFVARRAPAGTIAVKAAAGATTRHRRGPAGHYQATSHKADDFPGTARHGVTRLRGYFVPSSFPGVCS